MPGTAGEVTAADPTMRRMSTHIGAEPGEIAPHVLMPGDPLRARWIAETFLEDAQCYSEVRGMYGFTGTYRGERVSVQGSGMGLPSLSIYVNELFREYDVQTVVRVGSCGALTEELALRDLVIASGACTDSSMNRIRFEGLDYAPVADFELLRAAHDAVRRARPRRGGQGRADLLQRLVLRPRPELMHADGRSTASWRSRWRRARCTRSRPSTGAGRWRSAPSPTTWSPARRPRAQERQETFGDMVEIALDAMLAGHPTPPAPTTVTKVTQGSLISIRCRRTVRWRTASQQPQAQRHCGGPSSRPRMPAVVVDGLLGRFRSLGAACCAGTVCADLADGALRGVHGHGVLLDPCSPSAAAEYMARLGHPVHPGGRRTVGRGQAGSRSRASSSAAARQVARARRGRRCGRSRTPPGPARPGTPASSAQASAVDRELERVGGLRPVGLPVHDQEAVLAVDLSA